jgi:hypothetical protein
MKFNDFVVCGIRRKTDEFHFDNQSPTLEFPPGTVNNEPNLLELYSYSEDLSFVYENRSMVIMIERYDIVSWRQPSRAYQNIPKCGKHMVIWKVKLQSPENICKAYFLDSLVALLQHTFIYFST